MVQPLALVSSPAVPPAGTNQPLPHHEGSLEIGAAFLLLIALGILALWLAALTKPPGRDRHERTPSKKDSTDDWRQW